MTPLVVLFDIDGTLITTGGAGRRALERVFSARYGSRDLYADFAFSGMTDRAIIREGLRRVGAPFREQDCDTLLEGYVTALIGELQTTSDHRLHPGMEAAVTALRARPNTAVGLGTGNVVLGAEAKLAPLGAYHWFSFGGFGSDHEDRAELIRIGLARGLAELHCQDARKVIIGDTPKDVTAAKANGAEAFCVTTGAFDAAALRAAGADHVYATLAEAGALEVLLGQTSR